MGEPLEVVEGIGDDGGTVTVLVMTVMDVRLVLIVIVVPVDSLDVLVVPDVENPLDDGGTPLVVLLLYVTEELPDEV